MKIDDFKIEKNIPVPEKNRIGRKRKPHKYPYANMEVGDSFLVPFEEGKDHTKLYVSMWGGANHFGKNFGGKFLVRKVEDGIRVWRMA